MEGTTGHPGDGSRKRPRTEYHPWQRRKLKVGSDCEAGDGRYEITSHFGYDLVAPLPHQHARRSMPATAILLSSSHTTTDELTRIQQSSFFHKFFSLVGMNAPGKTTEKEDQTVANKGQGEETDMEDLEKSSLSRLTPAQHRRYLKLVQQAERRTSTERAHWKQLRNLVPVEQARFRQAVEDFWRNHKDDRILLGFQPSSRLYPYCQWACKQNIIRNQPFLTESPPKFGKCRQVLSLRPLMKSKLLDVATMDFQRIVVRGCDAPVKVVEELPAIGRHIAFPTRNFDPSELSLEKDTKALQIASEQNADFIATDKVLESLLQVPSDTLGASWLLPVYVNDKCVILQSTLAKAFANPRECLTMGIEAGLNEQLYSNGRGVNEDSPSSFEYMYTIWTLPKLQTRSSELKVLIRSVVWGHWKTGGPLSLRAHVDYFPERGQEVVSQHERSLWVLDQMLQKSSFMYRVDGRSGNILSWEETSVAHAFAFDTSLDDPMQGFAQVIHFFHAVSTVNFGATRNGDIPTAGTFELSRCRLFSLPSITESSRNVTTTDPCSVSVHAAANEEEEATFDISGILQKADGVVMNPKALQECQRTWTWDDTDRIPYTFPPQKNCEKKKEGVGRPRKAPKIL